MIVQNQILADEAPVGDQSPGVRGVRLRRCARYGATGGLSEGAAGAGGDLFFGVGAASARDEWMEDCGLEHTIPVMDPDETVTYERKTVGVATLGTSTYRVCIIEAPGEENTANNCASRSVTYRSGSAVITQPETGPPESGAADARRTWEPDQR